MRTVAGASDPGALGVGTLDAGSDRGNFGASDREFDALVE